MRNVKSSQIEEAIRLARELNGLLHEDAVHRLQLYQEYARDDDSRKWNPNLYHRCQLIESLCKTLDSVNS
jgi:hypothetical protein